MQAQLSALLAKAAAELPTVAARPEFEAAKARYVGPHGELTALMKQMGAVPREERPALGRLVNEAKAQLQAEFDAALRRLEAAELAAQLGPPVDPTLPVARSRPRHLSPADLGARGDVPHPAQGRLCGRRRTRGGDGVLLLRRAQHARPTIRPGTPRTHSIFRKAPALATSPSTTRPNGTCCGPTPPPCRSAPC